MIIQLLIYNSESQIKNILIVILLNVYKLILLQKLFLKFPNLFCFRNF